MNFATVACVLLGTCFVATAHVGPSSGGFQIGDLSMKLGPEDPSKAFTVENAGKFAIKITCEWFDALTTKITAWQSESIPFGETGSKSFTSTDLGIDCYVNIDKIEFPEIFRTHYCIVDDMARQCTTFQVWGTVFKKQWASEC